MSGNHERCEATLTRLLRNPARLARMEQRGRKSAVWGEDDAGIVGGRNAVWGENDDILNGASTLQRKFGRRPASTRWYRWRWPALSFSPPLSGGLFADALSQKSDLFLTRKMASSKPASGWASVIVKTNGSLTPAHKRRLRRWAAMCTATCPDRFGSGARSQQERPGWRPCPS